MTDPNVLPADLPVPTDDGAADHPQVACAGQPDPRTGRDPFHGGHRRHRQRPQLPGDRVHGGQETVQLLLDLPLADGLAGRVQVDAHAESRSLAGQHQCPGAVRQLAEEVDGPLHELGLHGVTGLGPPHGQPRDAVLDRQVHVCRHGAARYRPRRLVH